MKHNLKRFRLLPLLLALLLLAGCAGVGGSLGGIDSAVGMEETAFAPQPTEELRLITDPPETAPSPTPSETEPAAQPDPEQSAITEDGEYTAPQDVADYLHAYGHLPGNFITKKEAQALGWPGGDLWKYAPGKSIGGDYFGNYEGALPKGSYHECDVNYSGGSRGAERIIYGADGSVWYTANHYASFTRIY